MKAAILNQYNQPYVIEEIDKPEPREKEVLVKLVATGICHTDVSAMQGHIPVPLPIVLGHEGAGIVESVGKGVSKVKPGDHVILHITPYCGNCRYCLTGRPYLCLPACNVFFSGTLIDESRLLKRKNGEALNHFFAQSSFAEFAVVHEHTAIKIREDAPLEVVAMVGCGATTGLGAIFNAAQIPAGASAAIFGCGGVGLSAIMAANLVGAGMIIAVDIVDKKLDFAKRMGATNIINALQDNPVEKIKELTELGVDYAIECIGNTDVIAQAFDSLAPGGKAIVVGAPPFGSKVSVDVNSLLMEKTLMGCIEGFYRPEIDIPRYVQMFMDKKIPLDRLITHKFSLPEINDAFQTLERGEAVKCVIVF